MNIANLDKITKLYFTTGDIARALGISPGSANVTAVRYCKKGYIVRIKRGFYVLKTKWENLQEKDIFSIANILQVPSYISLVTALSYYGITTQLQQGYIESIALKRTKSVNIKETAFTYTRIADKLYYGFTREKDVFIASPEKAFLDAFYLSGMGKYSFDMNSIDKSKLDREKIEKFSEDFPGRIAREAQKWIS
jgi:predicted transcriptional regulator of viral defense system